MLVWIRRLPIGLVVIPDIGVQVGGDGSSYEASALYLLRSGCPAYGVVLLEREPNTNECVMEDLNGFEGVGAEKTDEGGAGR